MNRILIVLPNWYGETLFATPFLKALRTQRPEAFRKHFVTSRSVHHPWRNYMTASRPILTDLEELRRQARQEMARVR